MSWSWKEDREKKTYEIGGTVTISTEEYRDLIEETQSLLRAGQKEHDDWYNEYKRASDLEKEVKTLKTKISDYENWIDSIGDSGSGLNLASMFMQWKLDRLEEAHKDE